VRVDILSDALLRPRLALPDLEQWLAAQRQVHWAGFGSVSASDKASIHCCWHALFDTAPEYGYGRSEHRKTGTGHRGHACCREIAGSCRCPGRVNLSFVTGFRSGILVSCHAKRRTRQWRCVPSLSNRSAGFWPLRAGVVGGQTTGLARRVRRVWPSCHRFLLTAGRCGLILNPAPNFTLWPPWPSYSAHAMGRACDLN